MALAAVQPADSPVTGVPYVDFAAQYADERDAITAIVDGVFSRGDFVGGEAVAALEAALAKRCGTAHAVALGSGTDALILGLIAAGLRPGDDVITPPNSFVASTSAIVHAGAIPVFVDVGPDQNMDPERIEAALTTRTTAILPVHLTGRVAEMDAINDIAARHGLFVIEDAAQSVGSTYHGKASGSLGTLGCFSTHPLKNLGGAGDGGFVTTDDPNIAKTLMSLRNHGLEGRDTVTRWGFVSRMDTLQAAILLHRLGRLDDVIAARRANAGRYRDLLDPAFVFVPHERPETHDTFHTFVIQADRREALQASLSGHGIETLVHYPVPLHLQPAAQDLGYGAGIFPKPRPKLGGFCPCRSTNIWRLRKSNSPPPPSTPFSPLRVRSISPMSKPNSAPNLSVVSAPNDNVPETGFSSAAEAELSAKFLEDGHVVVPVEDLAALDRLRDAVSGDATTWLGASATDDPGALLDSIHARVGPDRVNDMRLSIINGLNTQEWVARDYFSVARKTIESVVGNELAMQRRLNLSVQMPGDDSSVLPVHADVWDGNSPFEVVLWVPLVDCHGTKAMFLLPPEANAVHEADFRRFADKSVEDLFHAIEPDVVWPEVRYGEAMVFALSLMHGNRVNFEAGTRWSFNCRFKSLFTPYGDKRLGEFFEPITIRAATRMGMDYAHLEGFDE